MSDFAISYVVTTYNKLPYLRQVLGRLVAARLADEEIVVADGGSTDGTPEYLRELFEAGQIQQFVSERDKGESHGFNKCMLMAKGGIIKLITDDDAFCYSAIREAAGFMQKHPEVDVMMGYTGLLALEDPRYLTLYEDVAENFKRWLNHKEAVWMIGLPMLIRRSALALTGLFNTGVVQVDTEFTYRITSLNVSLAWSSQVLSVRIENPQSNFRVMGRKTSQDEADRMRYFYDKRIGHSFADYVRHKSGWVATLKKPIRPIKRALFDVLKVSQYQGHAQLETGYTPMADETPLDAAFRVADEFMDRYNAEHPAEFLYKSQTLTKALGQ
ncbi:glycosyltransferase [Hymenobacter lapidiphilus]|uniref:Glycosyltransferase n=1 Tax=Hymenobacter lapidiphilus TaxID=2608003 RepID=A0A7Y7U692_9BACT|nr:glycosyltransferase [Hymenobacter lapidiphilus]NVO32127.1 glycosyltransferase [Hymenobacter lapidiphilus]